ncbi:MAG: ATP-binding protein [Bacteroidetes bacterium]|nr:ATP-binding protein [Bacteroidota bacterium]
MTKRIAITGPESTGKSQLAEELAAHYHTLFVAEYAREYIEKLDRQYTYDDVLEIAKGQLLRENEAANAANALLFCDTDFTVTKIWCDYKYKQCHDWINGQFVSHTYDIYLLCSTDLPWEYDAQRENPNEREELFQHYLKTLTDNGFPFAIINGTGAERLQNAIKAVDKLI